MFVGCWLAKNPVLAGWPRNSGWLAAREFRLAGCCCRRPLSPPPAASAAVVAAPPSAWCIHGEHTKPEEEVGEGGRHVGKLQGRPRGQETPEEEEEVPAGPGGEVYGAISDRVWIPL